jgi:hypothetical protein
LRRREEKAKDAVMRAVNHKRSAAPIH